MLDIISTIENINKSVNDVVWGPLMLVFIVGTGIYFTFKTNFLQIRKFGLTLKETLMKVFEKSDSSQEGDVTPFQALSTALAATIGTGNIAGVATAIATGGPGAVFWMWLSAFFGMMTKFAEVVLAVNFREENSLGNWVGGPMYYIEKGLGWKWLAGIFAFFGSFAAFGIGNMVQSNSVAGALSSTFKVSPRITGIVLAILTALVIFGGIKRIASFTEKLVPFMAIFYIMGALIILVLNISQIPAAFALIFKQAFTPTAAVGGFAGSIVMQSMRYGIARGVFTNEAGLGSAPIAHAAAKTDHPVRQGLWGIFEVFSDTIVVCSMTALTIIVTGAWQLTDASGKGLSGAALSATAFDSALPVIGGSIVSIGIVLFAFSTILGWAYYGEKCAEYLLGEGIATTIYRIVWIPAIYLGAVGGLELLWDIADTLNALMAIPNLIGLVGLSGVVFKLTKEFFKKELD